MPVVLRRSRAILTAIIVAASTAAALAGAPASGASGPTHSKRAQELSAQRGIIQPAFGFVRSSSASATHLTTPSSAWSFNSSGGTNTVKRNGTGLYTVRMPGLGVSLGNVQVTEFGASATKCKIGSWARVDTALVIHVRCYRPNGALGDSRFVAQWVLAGSGPIPNQAAYLATTNGASPLDQAVEYFPPQSYNSRAASVTLTRTGVGLYSVTATGFDQAGGNVAVTAIGQNGVHCETNGWEEPEIGVECYDHTGALANSRFSLRYSDLAMPNRLIGGYAWVAGISSPTPVVVNATYSYNTNSGAIKALRTAVGKYTVRLGKLPGAHSTSAMVTAYLYNHHPRYCDVTGWRHTAGTTFTAVDVVCHRPDGQPANSAFTLSYLTNRDSGV